MRSSGLWAVAGLVLGLSAWAVGQAPDDDLVDRLQQLREATDKALAAEEGEPQPVPRVGAYVLTFLEVGDLAIPAVHHTAPNLESGAEERYAMREGEHIGVGTIEELQELIRMSVQPRSWEEGGSIYASGTKLMIFGTPGLAKAVQDYLDTKLRPRLHRFVTVDARVLTIDREEAVGIRSPVGSVLAAADLAKVRNEDGHWVNGASASVRTTGRLGQQILVYAGRRMAQLESMGAELGDKVSATEPIVGPVQDGVALQVTVDGSAARGYAVSLHYQHADVTWTGKIDLADGPVTQTRTARATARLRTTWPDGKWGVASREDIDGSHRIVLVRIADAGGAR